MALYNNKYWLLSHIKNSFVSTDDTGMCELVMMSEDLPQELVDSLNSYPDTDDSLEDDDDLEHESYDIQLDADIIPVRYRSNTAARLEKMDQARKRAAKTRNIKWVNGELTKDELNTIFVKKDVKSTNCNAQRSMLSEQLERCTNLPQNPYMEYARFDGSAQIGIPIRKYKIFLTMLPEEQRNYPMIICCIATAKVCELIGLICLKCSTAHGDFPMQPVPNYGLYITEEDGEVEGGFPCLDPKECIAKFGFTCLGLVEHKNIGKNVSFDGHDPNISTEQTLKKSNSISALDEYAQQKLMDGYNSAIQAPDYKTYNVQIINKMRARAEVLLGISLDKIDIDPVNQKSTRFVLVKQRPVSYNLQCIASCENIESKPNNRCIFRIIYSASFGNNFSANSVPPTSASFKHYDFETDADTAKEIVMKINYILELQSSKSQREYLSIQEKKLLRRKGSFHLKY